MLQNGVLGKAIRSARMEKQYSQEKLAELVNITPTHIKHIESEHRKPSLVVLFDLAEVLDLSLDALIDTTNGDSAVYDTAIRQIKKCTPKECLLIDDIIRAVIKNRQQDNTL